MPPMPTSSQGGGGMRGPSTFDKWFNIMRYGAGANGPMRTLGQYMLGSAATFGFFMSIGTVIRTEGSSAITSEAFARARRRPVVLPRDDTRRLKTER
ncbi:MAG: hypothetical protein LQ342_003604 [Letrouitia transgressa]|nr:MAG: hypothetical protein LQ342_003604 [Letrouitia transgressa]